MSDTLADFLLAQLDADEQTARAAMWSGDERWTAYEFQYAEDTWHVDDSYDEGVASIRPQAAESEGVARHIALNDPASVLADLSAKRSIIAAWLPPGESPHPGVPCTSDADGDPDGENFNEPWNRDSCVHHLDAMKRRFPHDLVLRYLALPYRDRPGWKEEWLP